MASTFKNFLNNDITSTRTLLHEAIPITGSIVSGTYLENGDNETNIKNYSHGMFQSVFDYPHLSSSANHIMDITIGYHNLSPLSASHGIQNTEKINIYNQMAQILVGQDVSGNVLRFDRNGQPHSNETTGLGTGSTEQSGPKMDSVFFLNFARLLTKDEIKKGSFKLDLMTGSVSDTLHGNITRNGVGNSDLLSLQDHDGTTAYKVNSPSGEYGLLYSASGDTSTQNKALGLIYYQAGIAVITSSVFRSQGIMEQPFSNPNIFGVANVDAVTGSKLSSYVSDNADALFGMVPNSTMAATVTGTVESCFFSGSISASAGGLRNAIHNLEFNNTTELNSTIYFCRAGHNEFNYSSNPTYTDSSSKIRIKNTSMDNPVTYITSIGLYSADNELLAVAKLSEPIKKTPENELTFRVRLDY